MLRRAVQLAHVVAALTLIAMTSLVTAEVILRKVFDHSLLIVDELSGYLLVALTFFGASYSLQSGGLLRVDVFYRRMTDSVRAVLDVLFDAAAVILCALLTYYFWRLVASSIESHVVSSTMADTPLYIPQLSMVVGTGLMTLTFVIRLASRLTGRPNGGTDTTDRMPGPAGSVQEVSQLGPPSHG